jgi:hypothetical protein
MQQPMARLFSEQPESLSTVLSVATRIRVSTLTDVPIGLVLHRRLALRSVGGAAAISPGAVHAAASRCPQSYVWSRLPSDAYA